MAWGTSDCGFTHNEILEKILQDLKDEEREYALCDMETYGLQAAQRIVQRHIDKNYE